MRPRSASLREGAADMTNGMLGLSAYLHAQEPQLLTRERRERMLTAADAAEAVKVLSECGYDVPERSSQLAVEQMLSAAREKLYDELRAMAPENAAVEVFSAKYDYHNAKVFLKSTVTGEDAARLYMAGGRFDRRTLEECFSAGDFRMLTQPMAEGIAEAQTELDASGDARRADVLLDRAYFTELGTLAAEEPFLAGYVRLLIDAANLRAAVRLQRAGDSELMPFVLSGGGNVLTQRLIDARGALASLYQGGELSEAGELAEKLLSEGGTLTDFERACDDAIGLYFDAARRALCGEEVVAYYLFARETEWTAIRTILSGRIAGLPEDAIRAKLREVA